MSVGMEPSPRAPLPYEMHPNDLPFWQMVLPLEPNRTFAQGAEKARNESIHDIGLSRSVRQ